MKLKINGEEHEHRGTNTLDVLVEELGANPEHAALMLNGNVVPSSEWAATQLNEHDEIEILVFVGGG